MDDEKNSKVENFLEDLRGKIHRDVEAREKKKCARGSSNGLFWGAVLVLVGVAFLLDQLGVFPVQQAFKYWPALLIYSGAFCLRPGKNVAWGAIQILAGIVLLTNQFGYTHFQFRDIWPVALIGAGIWMMWNSSKLKVLWIGPAIRSPGVSSDPSSTVNAEAVFGSNERRVTSQSFQGGKIAAVFGEVKLDLRHADIEGDEAVVHADAVFGSVEIRVPDAWNVIARGTGVFGSFGDVTRLAGAEGSANSSRKSLIVKGAAVFGAVEIKN